MKNHVIYKIGYLVLLGASDIHTVGIQKTYRFCFFWGGGDLLESDHLEDQGDGTRDMDLNKTGSEDTSG
jgi:hypothetical protein